MKRWKITAKRRNELTAFLTEEALYMWLANGALLGDMPSKEYRDDLVRIPLERGDELFVEWLGSEYVYDDKSDVTYTLKYVKFTSVRALKGTWIPAFIDNIVAWVSDEIIPLGETALNRGPIRIAKVSEDGPDPVIEALEQISNDPVTPGAPVLEDAVPPVAKNG